ncbi:hypothetical protein C9374_009713 [Naegleria lovaniensis]|uniref:Cytochrome P450 n=1 Tax=Naegleria lovaniensis TaxID=51637 RepID=A0AA88H3D9_NAELO|nr:uncharacterized protein C9374_009713 [Naegleria lovaniensis]KAG2393136.1 hypothetical protein C9374_009713 [Naegleria lovaniensis]
MVQVFQSLYRDYGPVVQLSALGKKSIVIFDPDLYLQVHRASGSCPFGATDHLWMLHAYFEKKKKKEQLQQQSSSSSSSSSSTCFIGKMDYGTGEEWIRVRKGMQHGLFSPDASSQYSSHLHEVARDASQMLAKPQHLPLQQFLQRLSFEMVTYSLLGKRLGTLVKEEPLLKATIRSIECASAMMMGPLQEYCISLNTKVWRDWVSSVDYMLERTGEIVHDAMKRRAIMPNDSNRKKSYIDTLCEANELTMEEITANIPGLMMAGFETVASTLHWTLIHLAQNPNVQELLFQEISCVLSTPHGVKDFERDDISHMPYLRCVLRETHRLTPTAFAILRKLKEPLVIQVSDEASTNDYELPSNAWLCFSPVGMSMDPKFVESPHEFNPERYLNRITRKEREWPLFDHPLMRDGFGYGPRKCLGARLAEMELWIAICTIVRDFKITLSPNSPKYEIVNHAATYPSPSPHLIFTKRV